MQQYNTYIFKLMLNQISYSYVFQIQQLHYDKSWILINQLQISACLGKNFLSDCFRI